MTHLGIFVEVEFLWRNFLVLHEFVDARLPRVGSMEHTSKKSFLFFLLLYVLGKGLFGHFGILGMTENQHKREGCGNKNYHYAQYFAQLRHRHTP